MAVAGERYILALDQGTTGSAALVFDRRGLPVADADYEIHQIYPRPGWVSHNPEEIYQSCLAVARRALDRADVGTDELAAIGITNQRETTVVWDRATGCPIGDAVVWQCRRSAPLCHELREHGLEPLVRARTGLLIDAYFSATKIRWLLDNVEGARARAEAGELAFGTVDSWLLWRLSGGREHLTDAANASRTMLFDVRGLRWDEELCGLFGVEPSQLPEALPSAHVFGTTTEFGPEVPVAGIAVSTGPVSIESDQPPSISPTSSSKSSRTKSFQVPLGFSFLKLSRLVP